MKTLLIAALVGQSFNLNCTGIFETRMIGVDKREAFSKTYRVDLEEGLWCENECPNRFPIAQVSDAQIDFTDKMIDTGGFPGRLQVFVNRNTGEYFGLSSSREPGIGPLTLKWTGTCERAPFSGWPERKTKF